MIIQMIGRILNLSEVYKGKIKGAFVLAIFESILSKMPIFYTLVILTKFYEKTLEEKDCLWIGLALVITVLIQMLIRHSMDKLQSASGFMIFADKRMELGNHLRKLPMGYYTEGNIGKISSVLTTDMIFIEEVAMITIANMMSYILTSILLILFMFYLDFRLGLIAVVVNLFAKILSDKMNQISIKEGKTKQEQSESLTKAVFSFIGGIGVIKSSNLVGHKSKELQKEFSDSKDKSIEFEKKMTSWIIGLNIILAIGVACIFGLAVWLKESNVLSLSYLIGVLLFVFDLFGPLKALYGEAAKLTIMDNCLDRIEEVFQEQPLPECDMKHLSELNSEKPIMVFEHVSFGYDENEILHDVNFDMRKNMMTALVGHSGSGKSTIANLLARFWDVDKGKILLYGTDIRDIAMEKLMDQISMVFQKVYLFQDTIYNNILMGKSDATKTKVIEASKKARCYDFIMALPDGFQTVIGEGGATLSGGEKQRISIARCILKDAPIVILDEATASVDADNESYIQEAIGELVKGKTLLVIAHRLNTIQSADQILVIERGSIVGKGTHESLIKENSFYKKYCDLRRDDSDFAL